MAFYGVSMTALHTLGFMYLAYFFRYRRVTLLPCVLISAGYYYFFDQSLLIGYRLIVDNKVNATAR
jgi:predicted membrane protein